MGKALLALLKALATHSSLEPFKIASYVREMKTEVRHLSLKGIKFTNNYRRHKNIYKKVAEEQLTTIYEKKKCFLEMEG